jgi:hypothetical protein
METSLVNTALKHKQTKHCYEEGTLKCFEWGEITLDNLCVGAIVWGFVPIRDLKVMDQEKVPEAADQLIGMWKLEAGGSLADDYLAFSEDGTFTGNSVEWETGAVLQDDNSGKSTGTWYVTKHSPFMNLYWNKPPYQLTLIYNNGRVTMRGLEITEDGFSLTNDEGGGGYVPATEEDITLTDDHG